MFENRVNLICEVKLKHKIKYQNGACESECVCVERISDNIDNIVSQEVIYFN